jgi:hypothetical protein
MKRLTTTILILLSLAVKAQHQSNSTFIGVPVFKNARVVMNNLLSNRSCTLVSSDNNSFTVKYNHIGYFELKKFIYNPIDSVIYKMVGTIPCQDFIHPFEYYGMLKDKLTKEMRYLPYEYNDNPKSGEVYSKWQMGSSFITISVNYRNEIVHVDEAVLDQSMFDLYYSSPVSR